MVSHTFQSFRQNLTSHGARKDVQWDFHPVEGQNFSHLIFQRTETFCKQVIVFQQTVEYAR